MRQKISIDVTLVSGARPGLLKKTLDSFSEKLFRHFNIETLFVNIDPFEGGQAEVDECEAICRCFFPSIETRKPEWPNFTRAVKWLWQQPRAAWVFHLEDDWVLNRDVTYEEFTQSISRRVSQISLMTKEKNWGYRSPYHFEPNRLKLLGKDLGKGLNKKRPIFTTSPSFVKRDFVHRCAALMLDGLDPEKQLNALNPELNTFTAQYRNRFIGQRREYVAVDIGRKHRKDIGLTKRIVKGISVWAEER
ncbi:hypothetical protein [Roseibium album]|uniref:Glycosyl transferase family 2 n=1 Tax=Roseibium album TaxID=311410 RepID=A0A0M6ZK09_9HYPH|nr:hypothetical protein [Roseibium album]CTQ63108.1 hypothetical protein LA5094_05906 [Roseibium album]CTQ69271.1 hypothetical protein LA5096_02077 [Roseibium album]CTQ80610.1 hypothetical protein LA5095_05851 [Roseibium album]